jgi:hypothetical protein
MDRLIKALHEVREVVNNGWTQRTYARTKAGNPCGIYDYNAVSFCLTGAMQLVAKKSLKLYEDMRDSIMSCSLKYYYENIPQFNDNVSKNEVLQAIDYAIKKIEAGG